MVMVMVMVSPGHCASAARRAFPPNFYPHVRTAVVGVRKSAKLPATFLATPFDSNQKIQASSMHSRYLLSASSVICTLTKAIGHRHWSYDRTMIISMMKMKILILYHALIITPAAAFAPSRRLFGGIDGNRGMTMTASALHAAAESSTTVPQLEAILFDCDGVLADTERDGHRISFNLAFKNNGIDEEWSEERYGKLLEVGGGKERMTAHWVSA
jgi:hypothetical protein